MKNNKGFMSAKSIYSLVFYVVMIAALAGVSAQIMKKTVSEKAVSAVSLLRANYQSQISIGGYGLLSPTSKETVNLSDNLLTEDLVNPVGLLVGVGSFGITNRNTDNSVTNITNSDVCKAIGNVGWITWDTISELKSSDITSQRAKSNAILSNISLKNNLNIL